MSSAARNNCVLAPSWCEREALGPGKGCESMAIFHLESPPKRRGGGKGKERGGGRSNSHPEQNPTYAWSGRRWKHVLSGRQTGQSLTLIKSRGSCRPPKSTGDTSAGTWTVPGWQSHGPGRGGARLWSGSRAQRPGAGAWVECRVTATGWGDPSQHCAPERGARAAGWRARDSLGPSSGSAVWSWR